MLSKTNYQYVTRWAKKIKAIKLLGGSCVDCGNDEIVHLCFHHDSDDLKDGTITKFLNKRWSLLQKELNKCVLLCNNCHLIRHYSDTSSRCSVLKNKLINIYGSNRCQECRYDGRITATLSFHHIDGVNKDFALGSSFRIGDNWIQKVVNELDKCELLCENCHRMKHIDMEKYNRFQDLIKNKVLTYKEQTIPVNQEIVIRMYNEGARQVDISRRLGYAKSTISRIIKIYKENVKSS